MNCLRLTVIPAALLATGIVFVASGTGPFDSKLSKDQQILQALNRMTFGPRPGDIEEVRRLGVEKWIDLQLHPERQTENPDTRKQIEADGDAAHGSGGDYEGVFARTGRPDDDGPASDRHPAAGPVSAIH